MGSFGGVHEGTSTPDIEVERDIGAEYLDTVQDDVPELKPVVFAPTEHIEHEEVENANENSPTLLKSKSASHLCNETRAHVRVAAVRHCHLTSSRPRLLNKKKAVKTLSQQKDG